MKKLLIALAFVAVACLGQIPAGPCTSSPAFYAAGASYNKIATPNIAGFYAIAVPLTPCGAAFQVYSVTLNNIVPVGRGADLTYKISTTTGALTPLKQIPIGKLMINTYVFGTVGVAIKGGIASLGSSWGLLASIPTWRSTVWRLLPWYQVVNNDRIYGAGFGRTF